MGIQSYAQENPRPEDKSGTVHRTEDTKTISTHVKKYERFTASTTYQIEETTVTTQECNRAPGYMIVQSDYRAVLADLAYTGRKENPYKQLVELEFRYKNDGSLIQNFAIEPEDVTMGFAGYKAVPKFQFAKYSRDGAHLLVGYTNCRVAIVWDMWSWPREAKKYRIEGHEQEMTDGCFSSNSQYVLSCSDTNLVYWKVGWVSEEQKNERVKATVLINQPTCCALSGQKLKLAAAANASGMVLAMFGQEGVSPAILKLEGLDIYPKKAAEFSTKKKKQLARKKPRKA